MYTFSQLLLFIYPPGCPGTFTLTKNNFVSLLPIIGLPAQTLLSTVTFSRFYLLTIVYCAECITVHSRIFRRGGGGTYCTVLVQYSYQEEVSKSTKISNLRLPYVNHYNNIITCGLLIPRTSKPLKPACSAFRIVLLLQYSSS